MIDSVLYRTLVPDAPLHRRTEGDTGTVRGLERQTAVRSAVRPAPGLDKPRLTSSWQGRIDQLLLSFPSWATVDPETAAGYRSVIGAMRPGTEFVVVHATQQRGTVESWFRQARHSAVTYVPMPEYVSFTDWAEDAYVALTDAGDGSAYLMEPWEFLRAGDALIADAVEEYTDVRSSQAPLIFQGGNCLIGDEFWLLGTDYFADSVALLQGGRPPVVVPDGAGLDAVVRGLFHDYVDAGRELRLVGTRRAIPVRDFAGRREGPPDNPEFFLDLPSDGVGAYQPIFHIDMFVTLVGRRGDRFTVLVGDPSMADTMLGTRSPYGLADVYDQIARTLAGAGMDVVRNPLVHRPSRGRSFPLAELRRIAERDGNAALLQAVGELAAQGAGDDTPVTVRTWHHVTWNNCLVEDSAAEGRHVYLPTYGGGAPDLAALDAHMTRLWEEFGFTVHPLADFGSFARRQGVVHCIKKYLRRGD
jgi:hypothetical protein